MPLLAHQIADAGQRLFDAERAGSPIEPLRKSYEGLTPADAYAIQEHYAELRRRHGARLVGRKIGCTSKPIQELFGIDTPDYGHIFDDMVIADGGAVARSALIAPMIESELAFLLSDDLTGPGVTHEAVLAATDRVAPCMEVIDSRMFDWDLEFVDTVADNGSSSRCVIGTPLDHAGIDLANVRVEMSRNGEAVAHGRGDAVLGHPADSVAWLANALAEFDRGLEAGQYVLSGSMTTAIRAEPGDRFEASFDEFGSVALLFTQ